MNQFISSLKVILIIFVVQCYSRSSQGRDLCDSSGYSDCDSDNQVSLEINDIKRSETEEDYTRNSENVTEAATIEGVTCGYQYNSSEEEDEDDSQSSTLIDYPFSVSIQKKGAHYASGALIDKRWILSVAREFFHVRDSLKLFRARLGSMDCKRGGTVVPIKKIETHPYYIYGKPNFDLSLLRMAISVDYSEVLKPIGISNIKDKVLSAKFITTYWPRIVPDAGAPVVAEDVLWGITSGWVSPTCQNFGAPTIFTRLSSPSVRSWLDTQLLNL